MEQKLDMLIGMVAKVMEDLTTVKEDVQVLKNDVQELKQDMKEVKQRLGEVEKSLDYQRHMIRNHDEQLFHLTKENKN